MRSLPTQDQIDCLKKEGIDVKRLPVAGLAPIIKPAPSPVTGDIPAKPPDKSKPRQAQKSSAPPPVYIPDPPPHSMPDFPMPLVILVLVIVFLLAAMSK